MSSELGREPDEAYVWTWLPGTAEPVVAGRLHLTGDLVNFNYGRSYLGAYAAIPLYLPELPLRSGLIAPLDGLTLAGCLNDAMPDAWGQRVIMNRLLGAGAGSADPADVRPADLHARVRLRSESVHSTSRPRPSPTSRGKTTTHRWRNCSRRRAWSTRKSPSPADLDRALLHGSSVGGARPKALIADGGRRLIAKFSSTTDTYSGRQGRVRRDAAGCPGRPRRCRC